MVLENIASVYDIIQIKLLYFMVLRVPVFYFDDLSPEYFRELLNYRFTMTALVIAVIFSKSILLELLRPCFVLHLGVYCTRRRVVLHPSNKVTRQVNNRLKKVFTNKTDLYLNLHRR